MAGVTPGRSGNRAVLLRRCNVLRSKTAVFPAEILSLIFRHVCPPLVSTDLHGLPGISLPSRSGDFPTLLGSISHTWREVAWSTPQIWTTLSIEAPYPGDKNAQNLASLLDLFFTNVRNLPLTLRIDFGLGRDFEIPEYAPMAQIFFRAENLRKLGWLELNGVPESWLYDLVGPFPQLVRISLFVNGVFCEGYPFPPDAPMLREISLAFPDPFIPYEQWPMITVLKLRTVSAATAFQFLFWCPNLVKFYVTPEFFEPPDVEDEEEMPDTLTLPHLETLSSPFYHSSDPFLHRLRLPALQSLTWNQHETSVLCAVPPEIWTFVQNLSGAPLTTLRLLEILDIDLNFLKHIHHHTPGIESILLWSCNEATLWTVLRFLTPGRNGEGSFDEKPYWAKLKRLEIRSKEAVSFFRTLKVRVLENFGELVTDMLIERAASADFGSSLCVDLDFDTETKVIWTLETKERLQELDRSGAKVELLEKGKRMDWL